MKLTPRSKVDFAKAIISLLQGMEGAEMTPGDEATITTPWYGGRRRTFKISLSSHSDTLQAEFTLTEVEEPSEAA